MEQMQNNSAGGAMQPQKSSNSMKYLAIFVISALIFGGLGLGLGYLLFDTEETSEEVTNTSSTDGSDNQEESEDNTATKNEVTPSETTVNTQQTGIIIDYPSTWETTTKMDDDLMRVLTTDGCLRAIISEEGNYSTNLDSSILEVYKNTQSEDIVSYLYDEQYKVTGAKESKTIDSLDYSHLFTLFFTDEDKVYSLTMNFMETETGTQKACADGNDARIKTLIDSISLK